MNRNLIPAIIQERLSGEVLMLGYMNTLSLSKTKETGWVYFWSRKRSALWKKGETSGNMLKVQEICTDCDDDALLIKVTLVGSNVCHTENTSCFYQCVIPANPSERLRAGAGIQAKNWFPDPSFVRQLADSGRARRVGDDNTIK